MRRRREEEVLDLYLPCVTKYVLMYCGEALHTVPSIVNILAYHLHAGMSGIYVLYYLCHGSLYHVLLY